MRFLIFAAVTLAVGSLLHYYVWKSLFRNNRWISPGFQKFMFWFFMTTAIAAPVSLALFRKFLSIGLLTSVLITWAGLVFVVAVIIAFLKISSRILLLMFPVDERRREFLAQGLRVAAVAAGGAAAFHGMNEALCNPRVRIVRLPLRRWPSELNGFKVVQVTDLHVGPTIKKRYVSEVAKTIGALDPDILAITGDLVDGSVGQLQDDIAPLFEVKAKYGAYFCPGNHEYYSGIDEWTDHITANGVKVLSNENITLEIKGQRIAILGVDDWRAKSVRPDRGYDIDKATQGLDPEMFKLLLAHQPRGFEQAVEKEIDLQLSGHTHGGQIWPFAFLVKLQQPFVKGLHKVQNSHIYVSCGTGFWGPAIRVGAPSEITCFEFYNEAFS